MARIMLAAMVLPLLASLAKSILNTRRQFVIRRGHHRKHGSCVYSLLAGLIHGSCRSWHRVFSRVFSPLSNPVPCAQEGGVVVGPGAGIRPGHAQSVHSCPSPRRKLAFLGTSHGCVGRGSCECYSALTCSLLGEGGDALFRLSRRGQLEDHRVHLHTDCRGYDGVSPANSEACFRTGSFHLRSDASDCCRSCGRRSRLGATTGVT